MSFFGTRGGSCVTASQAILYGLASGGGLYVPAMFPPMGEDAIAGLGVMSYPQRAAVILQKYLEDYSIFEIEEAVNAAYGMGHFDTPQVAPVKQLDDATYVLELFHGPTLAFKDMALQLLPHLITLAASKNSEHREISILVATSGDTGKAALEGFRDVPGTSCTVFYPKGGVSDVQALQMVTTAGCNTHVISVDGNFDDTQTGVKKLFADPGFIREMDQRGKALSSANSINFGRLVPQVVYYFSAYADLLSRGAISMGDMVDFVVPTGNFGNILAGYYARNMGLPIGKLICASNRNNVLTDFFFSGIYATHRTFFKTASPSMDILISSNLERLLYEAADRDGELVNVWMDQLGSSGSYSIGEQRMEWLKGMFQAGCADDIETAQQIRRVFERHQYVMDPHTAVGSHVLETLRAENSGRRNVTVLVSTASPYKFTQDVVSALMGGDEIAGLDSFQCADKLHSYTGIPVPPQVSELKSLPVCHTLTCAKKDMDQAVLRAFDS